MKRVWLFMFWLVLTAHLAGICIQNDMLQYISKPLIIPSLIGCFLSQSHQVAGRLKSWIIIALVFSWAGDVLLMFQPKDELFFLLGLGSFLLAHIFYIVYFHRVRVKEKIKPNPSLLVVVVVYYAALINLLNPYLGEMKIPVWVYGVVISFMLMLAMHMLFIKNKTAGKWMMLGALLFVISDSVLAVNKFYQPFELAGIIIMLTYGLAQFFIVEGSARYINSADKR